MITLTKRHHSHTYYTVDNTHALPLSLICRLVSVSVAQHNFALAQKVESAFDLPEVSKVSVAPHATSHVGSGGQGGLETRGGILVGDISCSVMLY